MTPRGRTNQLLYHAELLLGAEVKDDEHAAARRMAHEEGALATLEMALNAALRELTEHAQLPRHDWRELLSDGGPALAALVQMRELARRDDSWLAVLLTRLDELHAVDGAARRPPVALPCSSVQAHRQPVAQRGRAPAAQPRRGDRSGGAGLQFHG